MKLIMALFSVGFILTGCGQFADGTSVWADNLWIAPSLPALLGLICLVKALLASRSGSKQQIPGRGTVYSDKNVSIFKIGWFWAAMFLAAVTIAIIVGVNLSR